MARLSYTQRELTAPGQTPVTVVEVSGSVDPDTLDIFEGMFDELIDSGRVRVALVFENLKYINSTGMGMMVQVLDTMTEQGGGIVLLNVPQKVMLVLEMLGLQELFAIVANDEEVFKALAGESVGPASVEVQLEGARSAPAEPEPEPTGLILACPNCQAELSLPGAGQYRCPRCRTLLKVDDSGQALAFPEESGAVTELSFPALYGYLHGASQLAALTAGEAGLAAPAATAFGQSLEKCLQVLVKKALGRRAAHERIHLMFLPTSGKLTAHVYCGGQPLPSDKELSECAAGVDKLGYSPASEGNLVTLEKSA